MVTADIVGSSETENFREIRDRALARLSEEHLAEQRVLARYTVTAWDEFQTVIAAPWEIPRVIWDLRLAFSPLELRIGVGLGAIDELPGPDTPINEVSSGEAFLRAREAMDTLHEPERKYTRRTALRSGEPALDRTVDLIYMLIDSLRSELSERQQETLAAYEATGSQEQAARRLDLKSVSTVSRSLQRSHYWQLVDAREGLRELLEGHFGAPGGKD